MIKKPEIKIVITGKPGSGKTILSQEIAKFLESLGYDVWERSDLLNRDTRPKDGFGHLYDTIDIFNARETTKDNIWKMENPVA